MKKIYKIVILIGLFSVIVGYSIKAFKTPDLSPAHTSQMVPEKIYSERLSKVCNKTILTLIDNLPEKVNIPADEVLVYILDDVAIVDFTVTPDFSRNFEFEQVFIYSIVNTLTQEKDVMMVEFTVNNKSVQSFGGEIDMSESFIPDYNIVQ